MVAQNKYTLPAKRGNRLWPMPKTYAKESVGTKREMRLSLMRGWYDESKPDVLMTRKDVFLAALHFWVQFYNKKAQTIKHQYPLPDTRHKVRMQKMFTHPRSAMVAPRGEGKTFTVIFEMAPMLAICRPHTGILIGSETEAMTKEKLKEIRKRVEGNGLILADFDMVYKKSKASHHDWTNTCLDFLNGSSLRGSSIDAATRGRHPLVGLIDDPEGKRSKNPKWRADFMEWLFHDYLNQYADKGTHVMWIGTILRTDSCLWRAIHNEDDENRFAGWEREILKKVYEDPPGSGTMVTSWPERMSLAEFERKKHGLDDEDGSVTPIGLAAVMAEFQGEPIPSGEKMFHREERKHGYVLTEISGKKFLYDPASGKLHDFQILLKRCIVDGGVDVADTPSRTADASAIVVAMQDEDGTFYFIDAWERRVFSDKTAIQAFRMGHDWKMNALAWEEVALGKRIRREAWALRKERQKAGFHVPRLIAIGSEGIAKELRIERLRIPFDAGRIKLPLFHEIDGHKPCRHPHRVDLQHLIDQFDTMTGEGTMGHDDLIDAAEMLFRIATRRPKHHPHYCAEREKLERWEKQGVPVDPMQAPPRIWTKRMVDEWEKRISPGNPNAKETTCVDAFV